MLIVLSPLPIVGLVVYDGKDERGVSFDKVAELYDSARPGYPAELVHDLAEVTGIARGCSILEIGAGTGKLTVPLSKLDASITAVEPGRNLAYLLAQKLPDIRVIVEDFETAVFGDVKFDLVVFATSFHWTKREGRIQRISDLLKPHGMAAVIETHHVDGGTTDFFRESQKCYLEWDKNTVEDFSLPDASEIDGAELEEEFSGNFEILFSKGYKWMVEYSSDEYGRLLETYSDILMMGNKERSGLLSCIMGLIEDQFSGRVAKQYLNRILIAGKGLVRPGESNL